MKWLNGLRMRLMLVGFVAAMVLGGGSVNAEIIMSEPTNVGPEINDAYDVQESDFSHDGLQLYFAVWGRPDGFGSGDIYMAERETLSSPWQEPVNLGPNVNSSRGEIEPSISSDGLELYIGSWDDYILRVCTRQSKAAPWSSPVKIGPPLGSVEPAMEIGSNDAWGPDISADGLSLYFTSTRVGGSGDGDIWVAKRATKDDPWGQPVNLGPNVNSSAFDWAPTISADGLTLIFNREFQSMWATTRKSIDDDWGPAVKLGFNPPPADPDWQSNFFSPALSPDGSTLYFQAAMGWDGYGKNDFWQVEFMPIVDFNGDAIVDVKDIVIMTEHWGENYPLCDIGPMPLGDGIVDVQDLIVLTEHIEPIDRTLIAHWALNEIEGDIASDSAGDNAGLLFGGPVWRPDEGKKDGSLQLDGTDDYISIPYVLNPASRAFTVCAWINGGATGQVIVSQTDGNGFGSTWLGIDPTDGKLMTNLCFFELVSEKVITDGQWHHAVLVWNGYRRSLYVDGQEVVSDASDFNALSATGGMYLGAGKNLDAETFFSGLIDDVRIYNKVLSAEEIEALAQ